MNSLYSVTKNPWPANLGSHRAVVRVESAAEAVRAHLVWRRRDLNPADKDGIEIDGTATSLGLDVKLADELLAANHRYLKSQS